MIELPQSKENQRDTSVKTIFKELEDIKQFQINQTIEIIYILDSCLFYFNFTKDQSFYKESQLEINQNIIQSWEDGFLKKDDDLQIIAYFQNIIQLNGQLEEINYSQLSKIKLFVKCFLEKNKFRKLHFVVQFNKDQQVKEIKKKMQHIFEGFFFGRVEEDIKIFCVLSKKENINGDQEIHQNDKFGQIYILNQEVFQNEQIAMDVPQLTINYFNKISNNRITVMQREQYFRSIGYSCRQHIQAKVVIVFDELNKAISQLNFQLKTLLELPTNLNNEVNSDTKIKQFQDDLKELITKIKETISNQIEGFQLYQLVYNILTIAREFSERIKQDLKNMQDVQKNISQKISQYLSEQQNSILKFDFDFQPEYYNILEYFKEYYSYDQVKQTIQTFQNQLIFWLENYDSHIPQRLSQLSSIVVNQSNSQSTNNSQSVVVLGMTKVGKSTLMNIVNNPDNMKLQEQIKGSYLFDVINVDERIQISHSNNSQTYQTIDLEIEANNSDWIFIDTPGFGDTCANRRLINQINIFFRLNKSKQFVILFMIDGEQLNKSKRDLLEQIKLTNILFNEQLNTQYLEQILIPVFTKVDEDMMTYINKRWETETMKDCSTKETEFLRIIKKKIDSNQYLLIFKADRYFTSNLIQLKEEKVNLSKEIQELQKKIPYDQIHLKEKKNQKKDIKIKIQDLKANKQNIKFTIIESSITNLRKNILNQCQLLINQCREQQVQQVQFNIQLSLTPSMQKSLEITLKQLSNFNIIIDDLILNAIVYNILYKLRSLSEIKKLLQQIQNSLFRFRQQQINYEQLWLNICKILDMPKNTQYIDEQLSQIQKFHNFHSICVSNQIEIQHQKFDKLEHHISLIQASCTQIKDTLIRQMKKIASLDENFRSRQKEYLQTLLNYYPNVLQTICFDLANFIYNYYMRTTAEDSERNVLRYKDVVLQLIRIGYYDQIQPINI